MNLVTSVRQTMKGLINATKNLKTSRDVDVFTEVSFDFSLSSIAFNNRQSGTFNIQYLVSPNPTNGSTAPSLTYDEIITNFDANKSSAFKDSGLILLSYSYEQSDIITDPTTGSVSLAFSINIQVAEKTR